MKSKKMKIGILLLVLMLLVSSVTAFAMSSSYSVTVPSSYSTTPGYSATTYVSTGINPTISQSSSVQYKTAYYLTADKSTPATNTISLKAGAQTGALTYKSGHGEAGKKYYIAARTAESTYTSSYAAKGTLYY